ncbi:unnamed protein product [Dovyalis caffra]|uniref:3-dehydroquinate synthase C-terminal domain-containing protein n=1 Tax=Dovyalis caffra TaxID=77055 RepID=A0AAV1RH71_9ROSI|nr:unnamed protein product [Dovyalis caffra]
MDMDGKQASHDCSLSKEVGIPSSSCPSIDNLLWSGHALGHGLGGVVLKVEDVEAVLKLEDYFNIRNEANNLLSLTKAIVTRAQVAEMGDRVCVDLCSLMKPGEGLLVGSFARGLFLVHSECLESNYIASRPFCVNVVEMDQESYAIDVEWGPVHAYVSIPGGRTSYLSELKAGKEVVVVDQKGQLRTAIVGRIKIETRPLILVEAKACITFLLSRIVVPLDSALLASEGKALLESGWWSNCSNLPSDHCRWPGIVCNEAGSIIGISPPSKFLKVRTKFGNMNFSCFSNLVHLDPANHELGGGIPPQISVLSKLGYLNLVLEWSSSSIPPKLGNLKNLVVLNISHNGLFGTIPSTLCLGNNNLVGSIPLEIGNLGKLEGLDLEIGNLGKLKKLDLNHNNLVDSIPLEIGHLGKLEELDLSYNNLVGLIPQTLGSLVKLRSLRLPHNGINGSIPLEIRNLTMLEKLDLDYNNLVGPIPSTLDCLSNLSFLDLSSNNLSAEIPSQLYNLSLRQVLDPRLSPPRNEILQQNIIVIVALAFSRIYAKPKSRPSMKFVSQEFLSPDRASSVGSFYEISLLELQSLGMQYLTSETRSHMPYHQDESLIEVSNLTYSLNFKERF